MLVTYRPELENPAREAAFGVFLPDGRVLKFEPGVNQDIRQDDWEFATRIEAVQKLLQINALEVLSQPSGDELIPLTTPIDELLNMPYQKAVKAAEETHDLEALKLWDAQERRVSVKAALARRLNALTAGAY